MASNKASGSALNKDWLFCPYTGAMLHLDAVKNTASCALSGYTAQLDGEPPAPAAMLGGTAPTG